MSEGERKNTRREEQRRQRKERKEVQQANHELTA